MEAAARESVFEQRGTSLPDIVSRGVREPEKGEQEAVRLVSDFDGPLSQLRFVLFRHAFEPVQHFEKAGKICGVCLHYLVRHDDPVYTTAVGCGRGYEIEQSTLGVRSHGCCILRRDIDKGMRSASPSQRYESIKPRPILARAHP